MFQPKGCCLNSARHFECQVVTGFFHPFPPPSSNEKVCVGGNILDCVMSAPGTNYGVDCAHGSSFSSDWKRSIRTNPKRRAKWRVHGAGSEGFDLTGHKWGLENGSSLNELSFIHPSRSRTLRNGEGAAAQCRMINAACSRGLGGLK